MDKIEEFIDIIVREHIEKNLDVCDTGILPDYGIEIGSYTENVFEDEINKRLYQHYKQTDKSELIEQLIDILSDEEEERKIAIEEGFNSLEEKLMTWEIEDIQEFIAEIRGIYS